MIICTACGNHNEDDDEFCGSCGKFLEWVGEKVEEPPPPEPEPEPEPEPAKSGLIDRVRAAVGIDEGHGEDAEAPGTPSPGAVPGSRAAGLPDAPADDARAADREAAERAVREASEAEQARRLAEEAALQATRDAEAAAAAQRAAEEAAAEQSRLESLQQAAADQAKREAEEAEEARRRAEVAAEEERLHLQAEQARAADAARQQAEAEARRQEHEAAAAEQARREADEAARLAAAEAAAAEEEQRRREAAEAETARLQAEAEAQARREAEQAEAARREAEAAAAAEEQRRQAEEEAQRQAAEARQQEEAAKAEAARRAAALLAKPKAVTPTATPEAPPPGRRPPVPAAPPPPAPTPGAPSEAEQPPAAAADATVETPPATGVPVRPQAQTPVAQQPTRGKRPPRPAPKQKAPDQSAKAGDLICGQCGQGNDPQRKFCRKCGNSLAEAAPAPKVPWYRRIFGKKDKPAKAGSGKRGKTQAKELARSAQTAGWKANRALGLMRRALLMLLVVGIAVPFALPNLRATVFEKGGDALRWGKNLIAPEYATVNPLSASASSEVPEHPASLAVDLGSNTYWSEGAPGDGIGESIAVEFDGAVDLSRVIITPGATEPADQFLAQPRPKEVRIVFDDSQPGPDGRAPIEPQTVELEDEPTDQTFTLKNVKQVRKLTFFIVSVYKGQSGEATSIAELEFRRKVE